jgi:DNA replication protein DnaC
MEARDEKRLRRLQSQLAAVKLLIVDELGYVPLSQTGAELLFEVFSQRHEHGSTIVTSNLPFEEWTSVFGNQRLTGALLDRLTHHGLALGKWRALLKERGAFHGQAAATVREGI